MSKYESIQYKVVSETDEAKFTGMVSDFLANGYELHGSPSFIPSGSQVRHIQVLTLGMASLGSVVRRLQGIKTTICAACGNDNERGKG